jgi:hypothetical protein
VRQLHGQPVTFRAYLGSPRDDYFVPHAPKQQYQNVELIVYANRSRMTLMGYFPRESRFFRKWSEDPRRYARHRFQILGRAWHSAQDWQPSRGGTACPVAVIIDSVESGR